MTEDELKIIAANLSALTDEASSVMERRFAHLYGLARALGGGELSDAKRGEYTRLVDEVETPGRSSGQEGDFSRLLLRADRISLCSFIYENLGGRHGPPSPEELLGIEAPPDEDVPNRVCYLHNFFTDKAFSIFADALEGLTVSYAPDFTGVCEEVYYSRAKYCILPTENSADGMLSGFRALVGKYELNYVLTCDVLAQDGESFTRFALLHRGIMQPPTVLGERVFEFTASFDPGGATLPDVLDAASSFGLVLRHINMLPASFSGRSGMFDLAFTYGDMEKLAKFLVFLSLELPQFEALGLYTHLSSGE